MAGSSNLLIRRDGGWHAETTDPQGVLDALAVRKCALRGAATLVIGCGGAGRAIAAALREAGAVVMLANRSPLAGRQAARKLGVHYVSLLQVRPADYALVINATPVGTDGVSSLVDPQSLGTNSIVVDLVYGRSVTPLVAGARRRGLTVIDGLEILDHQVRHQYERMAEVDEIREARARSPVEMTGISRESRERGGLAGIGPG
jgi:3-dehydroquinate dehydratase / shikimate dehydrogenase